MEKKRWLAILAAIGCNVIFGLSFLFAKMGLETMNPFELLAYRFLIASIILSILKFFNIIKVDFKGKNLKLVVITAIFQPVFYFLFELNGINLSTVSESGLVISLIPIFVAIFARIFLNEKLLKSQVGFIILSVSGVILINVMKDKVATSNSYLGVFLLFMAVVSAAFYNIGSKKSSPNFTPVEITYVMMWIGAVTFNLILLIMKALNGSINEYFTAMFSLNSIISLSYLAILSSIVAFFLVNYSISKLPLYQSAIFGNISTIVAILAGVIILKEDFGLYDIIGAIMIVVGILGTIYIADKRIEES